MWSGCEEKFTEMSLPIDKLIIPETSLIRDALLVIDHNGMGLAFVVNANGSLKGIITDGNIRRAILSGVTITDPVSVATTTDCVSLPINSSVETISERLTSRIHTIPLLDQEGRPVDYASHYRNHRLPVMEPALSGNELNYLIECIQTNWISSQGPFIRRFEQKFAECLNIEHALAVSNGTAALHLALAALEIGPGDEVIVPDLTFAASINAILYVGATPVLADVTRDTWTIDPYEIEQLLTPRTKAIMPVHLYGQPAEMNGIMEIARKHKLYVIEDAAEALGSLYHNTHMGTFGDAAAFSFFGNKLITTGEERHAHVP